MKNLPAPTSDAADKIWRKELIATDSDNGTKWETSLQKKKRRSSAFISRVAELYERTYEW